MEWKEGEKDDQNTVNLEIGKKSRWRSWQCRAADLPRVLMRSGYLLAV